MEYYIKDSNPLVKIEEAKISLGEEVYDNFGRSLQKVLVNDKAILVPREITVLAEGVLMADLTTKETVDLFWTLSKNKKYGSKK